MLGHWGPLAGGGEAPNGVDPGVSGRGPSGISGACEITNGGGFWAAVGVATTGFGVVDVTFTFRLDSVVVVVVVVESPLPKNFLKPPNQLDFLVVVSRESNGSGVITTSLL